ncbi:MULTISPECIES: MurR/RpiR family transcriptional regulator [Lactiplantibacillus]|jgi:DNA-binding MurR/RpiR family transcriptional regulator|uniref:MurR/RpiR family transcriptional regulator n=2 Tax=Lactiplantibacillus pentosus TaxID=1589 RepID=A0A2S9VV47_LACPE|nr:MULTISPECIES: MurR/RpiR family transcriptional regulator [Lactiplantibacillus]CCC17583.1 transcription regulator [Lactiplantibacillus pentosus IG1]MBU7474183.1 MurR/RpiR family transcriptional regulator [Lactiplantibacillus pentosus]MBU7529497.1 MurR/RpiR family transcriptional regulator [Lactiplantibacillus pentosus]MCC3163903.1 MurR/RpiR family transcriptional regulator [Lactiplantibacillus pentosus]MCJ8188732.1 MurR/RpiR family transcriptional regulator [Lactiplantibacillus pentosus]
MDVLTTINGFYPSLTKAEQKIAQYVLVNSEDVEQFSINELAEKAEVAETTIIRFCRKLHFKGYQDFKLNLARDMAAEQVRKEDSAEGSNLITQEYIDYLKKFSQSINQAKLHEAVNLIDHAHQICIFGTGTSGIVGTYLKSRLMRLGISVIFDTDVHLQAINTAILQKDDIVIAISASGNTIDVLQNVELARHFQTKVIAISNYLNSKLSEISDINLVPPAGSGRDGSELLPVMGQLTVIDLLCQKLTEANPERIRLMKERVNEVLINRIE